MSELYHDFSSSRFCLFRICIKDKPYIAWKKQKNTIWDPVNKGKKKLPREKKKESSSKLSLMILACDFFSCLRVWLLVEKPDGRLPDLAVLLCGQAVQLGVLHVQVLEHQPVVSPLDVNLSRYFTLKGQRHEIFSFSFF
jgi:hypothetical protein